MTTHTINLNEYTEAAVKLLADHKGVSFSHGIEDLISAMLEIINLEALDDKLLLVKRRMFLKEFMQAEGIYEDDNC